MKLKTPRAASAHQTIALYGPSGAGKSSLAATAPRPLFADSNKGLTSIANRPGLEHVRSIDVNTLEDLEGIYDRAVGKWATKFDTYIFDHFDDIQALVMEQLGDRGHERDDRRDPDIMEQRDYGTMGNKLRRYIRKFKRVPAHKILILGEKEDRETGRMKPSLIGALGSQLPYFVDHTLYLRIGSKGKRYIHLDPTDDFYAKTRAHWIPSEERKIRFDLDNPEAMTQLLTLLAAGEGSSPNKRRRN